MNSVSIHSWKIMQSIASIIMFVIPYIMFILKSVYCMYIGYAVDFPNETVGKVRHKRNLICFLGLTGFVKKVSRIP